MNVSNIAVSTAAALSMAGAIGLAYAQSYSEPQPGTSATTSQGATSTPSPDSSTMSQDSSSTMNQDSTGTTGTRSDSMYSERVARADRN